MVNWLSEAVFYSTGASTLSMAQVAPRPPVVLGVRTESWTAGRSGLEVRMYSREKVELFLLATEDGMGPTAAAEFAGVTVSAAKKWATGHLPRCVSSRGFEQKEHRKLSSLSIGSAHAF